MSIAWLSWTLGTIHETILFMRSSVEAISQRTDITILPLGQQVCFLFSIRVRTR
jgi:hypothetical protein